MPKHPISIFRNFCYYADDHSNIKKMILDDSRFTRIQKASIIEGLFLKVITCFEASIENLFLGLLNGALSSSQIGVCSNFKIRPISFTQKVLLLDREYLDWLPIEKTIKKAELAFVDGNPFSKIDDSKKGALSEIYKIRNAIAHESEHSKNKFLKITNGASLLPEERTPGGYLISKPSQNRESRFDIYITIQKSILKSFCENS